MYFYNSHQFRSHQVKVKPAKCGARSLQHLSMTWETCWMHQVSSNIIMGCHCGKPIEQTKKKVQYLAEPWLETDCKIATGLGAHLHRRLSFFPLFRVQHSSHFFL